MYFHLLKNFPQFVVIHIVKGFGVVNKAEVDVFLELSCFFDDPTDVGNLISGSPASSKSSLKSGSLWFIYCLSLAWRILSMTLLAHEMSAIVWWFKHSLALPFFGIGIKMDLLQSSGHWWVFQICWHIECSTFTALSFRIWNSSTGIPSPPLALFILMLPKAHLTSHSRMSGSRWVTTPSWLYGSWRSFLYSSSMFSCHLYLISTASVRSIPFLSFIEPIFAWNIPLVSLIFLKRSLVFPILLLSSSSLHYHQGRLSYLSLLFFGTLHSNEYIFPFLLCLSCLFFSQLFVSPLQTTIFPFCISFSWRWSWYLPPVQFHVPQCIVLQALADLIPWIYLSLPLYNHKGLDLGHTWMV